MRKYLKMGKMSCRVKLYNHGTSGLITKYCLVVIILIVSVNNVLQGQENIKNSLEKGVVHNFSDDGKYFVKFGSAFDFWGRIIQYNPGTVSSSGESINKDFDFVLRRATMATTMRMDRFTGFVMLGTGTQTFMVSASPYTTSKPTLYFYDFWGSYEIVRDYLRIGYGLNLYRGLSRYSSATASKTIGADVPMLSAPDVLTTDQLARHLGFFAAGNINVFNYRFMAGKPFVVNSASKPAFTVNKAADIPNNNSSYEGYLSIQLFEKETSFLPFFAATYLGKRKILNFGAGFYSHPNSTQSTTPAGDTLTHNKFHFAFDVFFEYPVADGGAVTFYGAFFKYNYGPNYFMNGGAGNTLVTAALPGSGISEPNFGTGTAIATQLAWLFPALIGEAGKMQVYYEGNYMFFDALNDPALHHNLGLTYYLFGQNLKFTAQYELRPYFKNIDFDSYKNMIILKTQFSF